MRRLPIAAALLLGACSVEPRTDLPRQGSSPASATAAPYREAVRPGGVAASPVFSPAIRNGSTLWMSGQIGVVRGADPPALVQGGVEAETRQIFENMRSVLAAAGLGFESVMKCTVFLADIADYAAVNTVYAGYFEGMDPPARSAMAASGLALGARVEIECVAAYPPGR